MEGAGHPYPHIPPGKGIARAMAPHALFPHRQMPVEPALERAILLHNNCSALSCERLQRRSHLTHPKEKLSMKTRLMSLMAAAALATVLGHAPGLAQSLTGKVSSAAEGAMEGVVISAKKGIVTVSVVSNAKGEFSFSAGKLGAGDYALSIRAAGYDLDGPSTVTIAGDKPASLDLKLTKTKNLAAQLSNLEWILSVPGTDAEKRALTGCTNCHTVERILTSKYTAEEMLDVIKRMAQYSNNSFHKKPQIRAEARDINRFVPNAEKVAAYFASINRSNGEQKFDLKAVPRVSGDG